MKTLLLDASTILAGLKKDEPHHEAAAALFTDDSVSLATIDLARYEVINAVVRGWRESKLVTVLLAALEGIGSDGGILAPSQIVLLRAAEIAEHHSISVYDAIYVAAADTGDRQLVSCDERDLVSKGLAVLPGDTVSINAS